MLIRLGNYGEINDYRKVLDKLEDLGGELSFLNLIPEKGDDSVKDFVEGIQEFVDKTRGRLDLVEKEKIYPVYIDMNVF